MIFGGDIASEKTYKDASGDKVGGNKNPDKVSSAHISAEGGTFYGEINGGGLAIGEGAISETGNVNIDIKGGFISNTKDNDYSVIRGGGVAEEGGTVNVDKATITLYKEADVVNWNENSEAGKGGSTDIYGGGVAMSSDSTAYTGIANITVKDGFDLRGVTVYGGGDGADVGTANILIKNAASITSHNGFEMYGGGHADEVKGASVNKATITVIGDRYANTFVAPEMPGAIYGGGRAKNGKTSRVDETTINIQGGKLSNTDIYAGGFALPADEENSPVGITQTGKATINVSNAIVRNIYGFGREVDSFDYYKDETLDTLETREAGLQRNVGSVAVTLSGKTDVLGDVNVRGEKNENKIYGFDETISKDFGRSSITIEEGSTVTVKGKLRARGNASADIKIDGSTHVRGFVMAGNDFCNNAAVTVNGSTVIVGKLEARGKISSIDIRGNATINKNVIVGREAGVDEMGDTISPATSTLTLCGDKGEVLVGGDVQALGEKADVTIDGKTSVLGNVDLSNVTGNSSVTVQTEEFTIDGKLYGSLFDKSDKQKADISAALNLGPQVVDFRDDKFVGFNAMKVEGSTTLLKADGKSVGSFNTSNMQDSLTLSGGGELVADINGITKTLSVTGTDTQNTTLHANNITLGSGGSLSVDSHSTLKTTAMSILGNQLKDVINSITGSVFNGQITIADNFDVDGTLIITDRVDKDGTALEYDISKLAVLKEAIKSYIAKNNLKSDINNISLLATLVADSTTGKITLGNDDNSSPDPSSDISHLGDVKANEVEIKNTEVSIAGDVTATDDDKTSKVTVGDKGSVKFDKKEKDKNSNENENSNKGKNSNKVGSILLNHKTS